MASRKTTLGVYFKDLARIDRDSVSIKELSLISRSENINLESEILFTTKQDNFISGYCGFGAIFGVNYNGLLNISYLQRESIYDRNAYTTIYSETLNATIKEETIKSKPTISLGTTICFGIEIKIIKGLRIYAEAKPGFRACQVIKNKFAGSNIYQFNCGLKFSSK